MVTAGRKKIGAGWFELFLSVPSPSANKMKEKGLTRHGHGFEVSVQVAEAAHA